MFDTSKSECILFLDMEKNIDYIVSSFRKCPFFTISDVKKLAPFLNTSDSEIWNLLNFAISRDNSKIGKISFGIYCVKKTIPGTQISYSTPTTDFVRAKYIGNGKKIEGYFSGLSFLNRIGYSDDVPGCLEIVSNLEKTRGREIRISSQNVNIRKPYIEVTAQNSRILPIFDVLVRNYLSKDPELISALRSYCVSTGIKKAEIKGVYQQLPSGAKRRVNIGGLLNGTLEG